MSKNNELKDRVKGKIALIGIGNRFRGDDGVGPELVDRLKSQIPNLKSQIELIDAGEVPENYLEKIIQSRPDTILLVDAVDLGGPPGETELIEPEDLKGGSFSTHNASLKLVIDYLKSQTEATVLLLGIQPKNLRMDSGLSKPVEQALKTVEECLIRCMNLG